MKTNFKISQFPRFLLRSRYAILFKYWKWLKLLNSVPFIQKTLVKKVYIRIWSFWLTFTVSQWMKKNSKISQFSSFLLDMQSWSKFCYWLKLFNSFPFNKKTLVNHVYISIWPFWLTFTALQWMRTNSKLVNLKISAQVRVCTFWLKFEND